MVKRADTQAAAGWRPAPHCIDAWVSLLEELEVEQSSAIEQVQAELAYSQQPYKKLSGVTVARHAVP